MYLVLDTLLNFLKDNVENNLSLVKKIVVS